jgi:hypothetical protein
MIFGKSSPSHVWSKLFFAYMIAIYSLCRCLSRRVVDVGVDNLVGFKRRFADRPYSFAQ